MVYLASKYGRYVQAGQERFCGFLGLSNSAETRPSLLGMAPGATDFRSLFA